MADLILATALLLGLYCFFCKDDKHEENKNHTEQVELKEESKEEKEDLFKNPKGISGY